ncbi:MAG TPA: methyl-accepting chemotaxis protein [Candidatus Sulfotelmatobacter sp.]|nr:methyl-accepting chemotaxis protein [Candidatus Sulfotelmatobacter sp.]
MFSQLKLTAKIIGSIVLVLVVTSAVSFWITQERINRQQEDAFRDKMRQITGMASAARMWYSANLDRLVPGGNFTHIEQVPVVVGWSVAQAYVANEGMKFHTPSLKPRDPKNQPNEFERRALEAFEKDSNLKEFSERVTEDGKEIMRFAEPVRVTQDCLVCHGFPIGEKDPFGYPKEGMKAGDLRAAFVLEAPAELLVEQSRSNSWVVFLISFFTVLATILVVYFALRRIVVRPVQTSASFASKIANKDLSAEDLAVSSEDEIGESMTALNAMKNNLRETVEAIGGVAQHLASASEEISASATEQSAGMDSQKDQTHQVATAMQEMSATVVEISDNSTKAADAAKKASDTARSGGKIVEDTLRKMREIAASVGDTAKKVHELGSRSDQIGQIIGVIDDIADQTNLLALNAAIEAARAGEQGRGFAVVADEVRKLAERTSKATKEIAQMIQSIQVETKSAVTAMESGTKQVESGVEMTAQAGSSLREIIKAAESVGEMVTHIATAATEQSSATEEVNNSVEQIAKISAETSVGAQEAAKACHDLSNLALDLQRLIDQFKIGTNGGSRKPASRVKARPGGSHAFKAPSKAERQEEQEEALTR